MKSDDESANNPQQSMVPPSSSLQTTPNLQARNNNSKSCRMCIERGEPEKSAGHLSVDCTYGITSFGDIDACPECETIQHNQITCPKKWKSRAYHHKMVRRRHGKPQFRSAYEPQENDWAKWMAGVYRPQTKQHVLELISQGTQQTPYQTITDSTWDLAWVSPQVREGDRQHALPAELPVGPQRKVDLSTRVPLFSSGPASENLSTPKSETLIAENTLTQKSETLTLERFSRDPVLPRSRRMNPIDYFWQGDKSGEEIEPSKTQPTDSVLSDRQFLLMNLDGNNYSKSAPENTSPASKARPCSTQLIDDSLPRGNSSGQSSELSRTQATDNVRPDHQYSLINLDDGKYGKSAPENTARALNPQARLQQLVDGSLLRGRSPRCGLPTRTAERFPSHARCTPNRDRQTDQVQQTQQEAKFGKRAENSSDPDEKEHKDTRKRQLRHPRKSRQKSNRVRLNQPNTDNHRLVKGSISRDDTNQKMAQDEKSDTSLYSVGSNNPSSSAQIDERMTDRIEHIATRESVSRPARTPFYQYFRRLANEDTPPEGFNRGKELFPDHVARPLGSSTAQQSRRHASARLDIFDGDVSSNEEAIGRRHERDSTFANVQPRNVFADRQRDRPDQPLLTDNVINRARDARDISQRLSIEKGELGYGASQRNSSPVNDRSQNIFADGQRDLPDPPLFGAIITNRAKFTVAFKEHELTEEGEVSGSASRCKTLVSKPSVTEETEIKDCASRCNSLVNRPLVTDGEIREDPSRCNSSVCQEHDDDFPVDQHHKFVRVLNPGIQEYVGMFEDGRIVPFKESGSKPFLSPDPLQYQSQKRLRKDQSPSVQRRLQSDYRSSLSYDGGILPARGTGTDTWFGGYTNSQEYKGAPRDEADDLMRGKGRGRRRGDRGHRDRGRGSGGQGERARGRGRSGNTWYGGYNHQQGDEVDESMRQADEKSRNFYRGRGRDHILEGPPSDNEVEMKY